MELVEEINTLACSDLVSIQGLCFGEFAGERSVVEVYSSVERVGLTQFGVCCSSRDGQTCKLFGVMFGYRVYTGPFAAVPNLGLKILPYRFEWAHHVSDKVS